MQSGDEPGARAQHTTPTTAPFDCRARPRATLAAASLPELCTTASVQWALANAGVHPNCNTEDDQFVNEMCTADDLLLRIIAARPSSTLADIAAKARLLQDRVWNDPVDAVEAITASLLSDVLALAAREGESGATAPATDHAVPHFAACHGHFHTTELAMIEYQAHAKLLDRLVDPEDGRAVPPIELAHLVSALRESLDRLSDGLLAAHDAIWKAADCLGIQDSTHHHRREVRAVVYRKQGEAVQLRREADALLASLHTGAAAPPGAA